MEERDKSLDTYDPSKEYKPINTSIMSNNLEGLIESHKKEEPGAKGMHY
jgi:hypothetical protein